MHFSFDSKLVRLKVVAVRTDFPALPEFRFQIGAIKSLKNLHFDRLQRCFDSKLVRLKD